VLAHSYREISAVSLQEQVTQYLHATLGIRTAGRPWPGAGKLPYYLQDEFDLHELRAADRAILLALNRRKSVPALSTLRARLDKLQTAVHRPVVYVTAALASYERKRLIEQKVPFIVPGNQLYLPDLGIDLREYFRQERNESAESLSPAAQAMLLTALLSKSTQAAWQPAVVGRGLGYTAMTASRAVNELTSAGIAKLDRRGRTRWLLMEMPPAQTWEAIKPRLRAPVKREFWAQTVAALDQKRAPLAGLSALALYTQLTDQALPIYAVGVAQLKSPGLKKVTEVAEPVPGGCQVQVWTYTPLLVSDSRTDQKRTVVDPLSLSLSLQDSTDERIQLALEELKEHLPW
jgi:hypothetical protein